MIQKAGNFMKLNKEEMKKVLGGEAGGGGHTNCSTDCDNAGYVEITECDGRCSCGTYSCTCAGPTASLTKYCPGHSASD